MKPSAVLLVSLVLLALTAGCGTHSNSGTKVALTERQRDSILATEKAIPGAAGVGRALDASDAEAARAANMNAEVDSLPR